MHHIDHNIMSGYVPRGRLKKKKVGTTVHTHVYMIKVKKNMERLGY